MVARIVLEMFLIWSTTLPPLTPPFQNAVLLWAGEIAVENKIIEESKLDTKLNKEKLRLILIQITY